MHNTEMSYDASEEKNSSMRPQYRQGIIKILEVLFPYGFNPGSVIDKARLRNYAEKNGYMLPLSDNELEQEIYSVGTQIGEKIYIFDEGFLQKLADLMNVIFESGISAVFFDRLLDKERKWLSDNHITSENMLKETIKIACPDFCIKKNFITRGERTREIDAVVSDIQFASYGASTVSKEELFRRLEYIPPEKIENVLSSSEEFVRGSDGRYFIMDCFQVDDEDKRKILAYVSDECDKNGYASIADIPLDFLFDKNDGLTKLSLYGAVYSSVLKPSYQLQGKILSPYDSTSIHIAALLGKRCKGLYECSVAEVMEMSKELAGLDCRQDCYKALYKNMVRVSKNAFFADSRIAFDTTRIDEVLGEFMNGGFAPVKGITTFALFPDCGVGWNHYLLESFCYRFSKEYSLQVRTFNDTNTGIIVRKNIAKDYEALMSEAVAKSDIELSEEKTMEFLCKCGYIARRRFSELPKVVALAKAIREDV